jgi:hypothetical protein
VSKKIPSKLAILLSSVALFLSHPVLAAQDDDLQLTSEERAETHRKRKPEIAERKSIRAALNAMRNNGAMQRASRRQARIAARRANRSAETDSAEVDLVSIKHVLTCETEAECQSAVEWGNNNNFNTTDVLTSEGHGGEIMYHLFLRQDISPDEDTITSESTRVHEGVKSLDGIRYATWMVDFDPEGSEDGEGSR